MLRRKLIHINKHVIGKNNKNGTEDAPITIKVYRGDLKTHDENIYAQEVEILGKTKVIHSPKKPLQCGTKVWIKTYGKVLYKPEMNSEEFSEIL